MLRITLAVESADRVTLRLEGNVDAECVDLLERECAPLLAGSALVSLEMTAVRLVDRAGTEALGRLGRAGVEIRCRPGVVASVLENEGIEVTLVPFSET